jgi:hypothetical protein
MGDVVFVAVTVAFFTLAALFVRACDRLIGPDPDRPDPDRADPDRPAAEAAAEADAVPADRTTSTGRRP